MISIRFCLLSLALAPLSVDTSCPPPPQSATASFSPSSLSFGPQVVSPSASASTPQSVTLTAGGNKALTISAIDASGQFSQTNNCPSSLSSGQTCDIQISFLPNSVGVILGAITLSSNASGGPHVVSLSGTGLPPVGFSPVSLDFGSVNVNATSSAQTITLANNQSVALGIGSIGVSGDYSQTNNCPSSLAAGQTCQVSVRFKPTLSGVVAGTLNVTTNASPGTQPLALTGIGAGSVVSNVGFSSSNLVFGNQEAGTASGQKTITVTNNGVTSVTIQSVGVSAGYTSTENCAGQMLAPGDSCSIHVTFQPVSDFAPVDYPGAITVLDSDSTSPQVVGLVGTGVAPMTSSPPGLDFGNVLINTTSAPQTVTLMNNDAAGEGLTIASSGGFALNNNACGTTLASGSNCTSDVTFSTNTFGTNFSGPVTGALTVSPSSGGFLSPSVVNLKACATRVLIWPHRFDFGAVPLGSTATETLTLYAPNNGSFNSSATAITGANPGDFTISNNSCNGGPISSCTMDVTYAPKASGVRDAVVSIADDDGCSPHQQPLTGGSSVGPFSVDVQVNSITGAGTVTSSPSGINCDINTTPCSAAFASGASVTLDPAAGLGAHLTGWSGDCSGTGSCLLDMNSDKEVTATFDRDPQLIVVIAGSGNGVVSSNPATIDCEVPNTPTMNCVATFPVGASVTLRGAATSGSTFAGWTGGGCSGTGVCTFTSSADQTITATFNANAPPDFSLSGSALSPGTVKAGQSATGTVTVNPTGGFNNTVAFSCSVQPSPSHAPTCSVNPSGSGASVTAMTTAPVFGQSFSRSLGWSYALWIPLIGFAFLSRRTVRKNKRNTLGLIIWVVLLSGITFESACGGGGPHPTGGTPAGNYTITVNGASGALQHSTTFALTVH